MRVKTGTAWEDRGPGAAGAVDGLAAAGRLSALSIPETAGVIEGGAGPIERRQVTEAERAAWRHEAIDAAGDDTPLAPADPPATDELEEEHPMPEPDAPADGADLVGYALAVHAEAVEEAREARVAYVAAQLRWERAQAALAVSYPLPLPTASTDSSTSIPKTIPVPAQAPEPKRRRPGGDAERTESIEARGQRVLEVLDRHGGNTKAAGDELGMRGNVVARIASAARSRAAAAS